ncbi:MAG: DUF2807 domain-containing protein [Microcoleus sp. CAN_BIN18]|nr:DUF2807 domain-containing protein [Microcoleus sp. CAN_BIN18]
MKILTLLSIGLVTGLVGCNLIILNPNLQGSGIVKTEKRSLASFDSLDAKYVGSIQVRSQGQESLEISGDDNIIPLITTEVKNGTLYIRPTKGYNPQQKLQIIVSTPDIKKFVFDGVGKANLSNVKNDRLEIVVNGVGDFSASGETKEADITLSGVGSVDAKNLHTVNAKVNSTGVGNVDIYVTGKLDAKTSGVGEINYYGSPKIVNSQAEGIGKINKR